VIGAVRIAIVHGDCESLAGWGLSREALAQPAQRARVKDWFTEAQVNVIASSHSCLPVIMDFAAHDGLGIVVNNGAAGMPNFANTQHGVITRIGLAPSPHQRIYGTQVGDAYIDALAVHYDTQRWRDEFHANWPPGSPAHASYSRRIENGPHYRVDEAYRLTRHRLAAPRPVAA
jgi:hypothetical protein